MLRMICEVEAANPFFSTSDSAASLSALKAVWWLEKNLDLLGNRRVTATTRQQSTNLLAFEGGNQGRRCFHNRRVQKPAKSMRLSATETLQPTELHDK